MTDVVSTANLIDANESLDVILEGLRHAQRSGIEVRVEELAMIALADGDSPQARARQALVLAICLQRLVAQ